MPKPLRIYINGRFLCQTTTGVQRYARGLSNALQQSHPEVILLAPRKSAYIQGLAIKRIGLGSGVFWEQFWLPLYLLFRKRPLLINLCNTAPLLRKRQIVCIHDLAYLKDHGWFHNSFRSWYSFLIPRISKRSKALITVSESMRKEIQLSLSVPMDKINVVPNGLPEITFEKDYELQFPYLLLTGVFNPRKNAQFVLAQRSEIKKRGLHIVCIGSEADIFGNIEITQDEHIHWFKYVEDGRYYSLIKQAQVLAFPSEYEGFGIPILEALILGTPVIAPDLEIYRESFATLPNYYKKGDTQSFLNALDEILLKKSKVSDASYLKILHNFEASSERLWELILLLITKQLE